MIKHSVTIMRGCFGGCTFCSITEHEGRIIQNRSEGSVLQARSSRSATRPQGFTGSSPTSAARPPTCTAWPARTRRSRRPAGACRASIPSICPNLNTSHDALISLYRKARELPGIKKVHVASGVRYDLAVEEPGLRQGARHAPRRRLPEDRARAHRGRPAVEDDEARHRRLRALQGSCSTRRPRRPARSIS